MSDLAGRLILATFVSFEANDSSADMLGCQQLSTTLAVPSLLQAARLFTAVGVRETRVSLLFKLKVVEGPGAGTELLARPAAASRYSSGERLAGRRWGRRRRSRMRVHTRDYLHQLYASAWNGNPIRYCKRCEVGELREYLHHAFSEFPPLQ